MLYCFDSCCGWEMLMRSWNGLRPVYEFVVLSWRPSGGRGARCSAQFGCGFQPHNWRLRRGAITGTCRRHEIRQRNGDRGERSGSPQNCAAILWGERSGPPQNCAAILWGERNEIHQQCKTGKLANSQFSIARSAISQASFISRFRFLSIFNCAQRLIRGN